MAEVLQQFGIVVLRPLAAKLDHVQPVVILKLGQSVEESFQGCAGELVPPPVSLELLGEILEVAFNVDHGGAPLGCEAGLLPRS